MPGRDAYTGGVNFDELGLQRVARAESYRGFVFASFDPGIVDLETYLAGAKDYIDLVVDGCGGSAEIVRGTNQYSFNANWKLLVENSIDGYHAESTHDTYFKYLVSIGTDLRGESAAGPSIWATGTPSSSTAHRGAARSPSGSRCSGRTPASKSTG